MHFIVGKLEGGALPKKSYNFDESMIYYCEQWLKSKKKHEYLTIKENNNVSPRSTELPAKEHILWVRGKERICNIQIFEEIANKIGSKNKIKVISNDKNLVMNSEILRPFYTENTPINDFRTLCHADYLYTQISGFCIAPFMLSQTNQTLYLLEKRLHQKAEFPYLDKDWIFFDKVLTKLSHINIDKRYIPIRSIADV